MSWKKRLLDYRDLVMHMRLAQKAYFQTRSHDSLTLAKELERQVDEVSKVIAREEEQGDLF